MITRLLRRLQGFAPRQSTGTGGGTATSAGETQAAAEAIETDSPNLARDTDGTWLETRFLALVLGAAPDGNPPDDPRSVADVETALHHLRMVAERFDVKRMPRLPALVPQLLASMRRDDGDAAQMATLLSRDPMLAGEVVRVANSAYYRRSAAITSLQQAVQTLGHEGLRHVVLTTVMRPILRAQPAQPGYASAEWLWQQSQACTFLCSRLAPGRCDPGEAQLAGVVAGVGASALLRMAALPMLLPAAPCATFAPGFELIARRITARAAAHWALPPPVRSVLEAAPDSADADAPLWQVLRAARWLSMATVLIQAQRATPDEIVDANIGLRIPRSQRLELLDAAQREHEALLAGG